MKLIHCDQTNMGGGRVGVGMYPLLFESRTNNSSWYSLTSNPNYIPILYKYATECIISRILKVVVEMGWGTQTMFIGLGLNDLRAPDTPFKIYDPPL